MNQKNTTITTANQKGGVGKTTTTVNLAGALSMIGHKVLVIDTDPQGNATKSLTEEEPPCSVSDIFNGESPPPIKTSNHNINLIPADKNLSSVTSKMTNDYDLLFKLKDYIKTQKNYNFILIDTPPTLLNLTLSGMIAAEYLLIPISTQYYSLQGTNDLIESYQKVRQRLNPDLKLLGACISMHDKRTALSNEILTEIQSYFNGQLFTSIIPKTVKIEEAQAGVRIITDMFPGTEASRQYLSLAKEITAKTGEVK